MREIILTREQINEICERIANQLDEKFKNAEKTPVFTCVLKGATNFFAELITHIKMNIMTDYIQASSYNGTESTGIINLKKDFSLDIKDRDVIIVEDIIDTGYTLSYIEKYINERYHPKSVTYVCLIDKKPLRKTSLVVDYSGLVLEENKFLIGFGLDYNEILRNVNYIYVPDKEEIEQLKKAEI